MHQNDLFYLCSLLESLSRTTGLSKSEVIDHLGDQAVLHLYKVANVNHCLPLAQVTEEVIEYHHLPIQEDKVIKQKMKVSVWDAGHIYQRLILDVSTKDNWFEKMKEIYHSWICAYLDDYDNVIYWQSRSYIRECYLVGKIL